MVSKLSKLYISLKLNKNTKKDCTVMWRLILYISLKLNKNIVIGVLGGDAVYFTFLLS